MTQGNQFRDESAFENSVKTGMCRVIANERFSSLLEAHACVFILAEWRSFVLNYGVALCRRSVRTKLRHNLAQNYATRTK